MEYRIEPALHLQEIIIKPKDQLLKISVWIIIIFPNPFFTALL